MPRYEEPTPEQWKWAWGKAHGIDFSDTLFVLSCGCILDGCVGAAGLDRFFAGKKTRMYCNEHKDVLLVEAVSVGEPRRECP